MITKLNRDIKKKDISKSDTDKNLLAILIRPVSKFYKRLKQYSTQSQIKLLLHHATLYIQRRPRLKRMVVFVLKRHPLLKSRLTHMARMHTVTGHNDYVQTPSVLEELSPRALQIYQDLNGAIKKNRKSR